MLKVWIRLQKRWRENIGCHERLELLFPGLICGVGFRPYRVFSDNML
jgi:hypothetical protein